VHAAANRTTTKLPSAKGSHRARFLFLHRQPRNFEQVTLVARQTKHFRGFWVVFLVAQLPPKTGVWWWWLAFLLSTVVLLPWFRVHIVQINGNLSLLHKNSFAPYSLQQKSVDQGALMCLFQLSNLSALSLLSWRPTHTYLWGKLCFVPVFVCSLPLRSRQVMTPITRASLKRFQLKLRTRRPVRFFAFIHRGACAPGSLRIYFDSSRKMWSFGSGWLMWEV